MGQRILAVRLRYRTQEELLAVAREYKRRNYRCPGQPVVSNLTSTSAGPNTGSATLSWPAATAGTYPIANYQVYQIGPGPGAVTLVGSPTGTTFNLSGLTIGQSYT